MSFSLIVFIGSGLGIVMLIGLKMLQMSTGRLFFWPHKRQRIEQGLQEVSREFNRFLDHFDRKSFYILLHYLLTKVRKVFGRIQRRLDVTSLHVVEVIRGKKTAPKNPSASSYFLKDIGKHKDRHDEPSM